MSLFSGLLLLDNPLILWWYADSTKELVRKADEQRQVMEQHLAATRSEFAQAAALRLIEQKPLVFIDRREQADREGYAQYVAHNVGGGFAVNVYYFDITVLDPILIGSLAAGEERPLPANVAILLREGGSGLRHLLVAEAPYSRTTQWTPSLNFRTQEGGSHRGQVIHRAADVTVEAPHFQYQSLSDYMRPNAQQFRAQLQTLANDEVASAL
jgi:hypothetical protein